MICPNERASFKDIVIAVEFRILTSIDWQMHAPTCTMFLRRYYRIVPLTSNLKYRVAQCLCERVLYDPSLTLPFTPSVIAATCAMMAAAINTSSSTDSNVCYAWNENMANYTNYQAERDIIPCLTLIQAALRQETTKRTLRYVKLQQEQIMQATVSYFDLSWYERTVLWSQHEMADKELLLSTMRARSRCGEEELEKLKQRQKYLSYLPSILEAAARKKLKLPQQHELFSPLAVSNSRSHSNSRSGMEYLLSAASANANDDSMASGITDCALETSLLSTPSTKEDSPAMMNSADQSDMYEVYDFIDKMIRETNVKEVMHDAVMFRYQDVYGYLVTFPPSEV